MIRAICLIFALMVAHSAKVRADHLQCERDPGLVKLATSFLDQVELPQGLAVQQALREVGSDLPTARLARFLSARQTLADEWLQAARQARRGRLVCGFASFKGRALLVVADRLATLRATNSPTRFVVTVESAVDSAYGFALTRNGRVRYAPLQDGVLRFEVADEIESVQVLGQTRNGPLVVARWNAPSVSGQRQSEQANADRDVYRWLSDLHEAAQEVSSLRRPPRKNRKLGQAAQEHAVSICKQGRAEHVVEGRGAASRMAAHGLRARDVGEVLARAPTLGDALGALFASASHRLVLTDARMTDVGFGIHDEPGAVCIVGLFASWPRPAPTIDQ